MKKSVLSIVLTVVMLFSLTATGMGQRVARCGQRLLRLLG